MDDVLELLELLLASALLKAHRLPTPEEPPEPEWNTELDVWLRRFGRTEDAEEMSPEIAVALIPRIYYGRSFTHVIIPTYERSINRQVSATELIEELLIKSWYDMIEPMWMRGDLPAYPHP